MEGENVKACVKTFHAITAKAARLSRPLVGACAAENKALTNLSDISSRPLLFASLLSRPAKQA